MVLQVGSWRVENRAMSARGEVPIAQFTPEERRALTRSIYLAFARALAPAGVEVREVRPR